MGPIGTPVVRSGSKVLSSVSFHVRGLVVGLEKFRLELSNLVASNDITVLVETHLLKQNESIAEFESSGHLRKTRVGSTGGGISIFHKSTLTVIELKNDNDNVLSVRVSGAEFQDTLLLLAVYFPPKNSALPVSDEAYWETLEETLTNRLPGDTVIFCADFNARIGPLKPLLVNDNDFDSTESSVYERVQPKNVDQTINERGRKLIEFCSAAGLTPLNGLDSFAKNFHSSFTCCTYNEASVVDYIICAQTDVSRCMELAFLDELDYLSDHIPVRTFFEMKRILVDTRAKKKSTSKGQVHVDQDAILKDLVEKCGTAFEYPQEELCPL